MAFNQAILRYMTACEAALPPRRQLTAQNFTCMLGYEMEGVFTTYLSTSYHPPFIILTDSLPSQCICGVQLSPNARKISVNACKGGQDNVAVYSIISRDETHKQGMQSGSLSSDDIKDASATKQPAATVKSTSSPKTDTKDQGAAFQTIKSQETPPSVGPFEPKQPVSSSTIIAIILSLTGAIALAACVLLFYRARKRKQGVQSTHVKLLQDKRGARSVPDPIIMTGADIHNNIANVPVPEYRRDQDKDGGRGSISSGTDYRNHRLMPTTPALESGGRFPADFHVRVGASAVRSGPVPGPGPGPGPESRTTISKGGNGLHGASTGDIRSRPAHPRMNAPAAAGAAGAGGRGREEGRERERERGTSGEGGRGRARERGRGGANPTVQRQPNNNITNSNAPPTLPKPTARERAASSSGLTSSPPTAGLGERASHRRKISAPYQPPGVGLGIGIGGVATGIGSAVGRGRGRGSIARGGPPGGPPDSLPPMPPIKPGMRAMPQARPSGASAGPASTKNGNGTETARNNRPPARPHRRSFDEVVSEAKPVDGDTSAVPAALGTGTGRGGGGKGNALGMSHTNASTPTLGQYGSITKRGQPMAESPVLGWMTMLGGEQWGVPLPPRGTGRGRGGEGDVLANREPKIPVLPPVAPGERFDHRRWEGTLYAQPHEGEERGMSRERGRRDGHGHGHGDWSPVSTSSAGTSILFGLEELDRRV